MSADHAVLPLARQAIADGRWDDAERLCLQILKDEPDESYPHILIGIVHLHRGRPEMAHAALALACEKNPTSDQALVWLSRALRKMNRKEEALKAAASAAGLNPSDPTIQHHLGVCQLEMEQFSQAAESFRRADQIDPDSPLINYFLGLALHRAGDLKGAVAAFRNCLRLSPGDARAAAALRKAESEIEAEKTSAQTVHFRIEGFLQDGRPDQAEAVCREAMNLFGDDSELLFEMGLIKVAQGALEEASSWLERAWSKDRTSGRAPHLLSITLRSMGRVREALDPALAAVENDPQAPGVHNQLGLVYADLYRLPDAIASFRRAIRAAPEDSYGYLQLADALQRSDQPWEAIATLRESLSFVVDPLPIRRSLVDMLLQSGDLESAIKEASANVDLAPDSAEARIGLALCYLKDLREDLARDQIEEAKRIGIRFGSTAYQMGKLLQDMGRVEESEGWMLRSIELEPSQGAAYSSITHLRKITEADWPLLSTMKELAGSPYIPVGQKSLLHYGMGKSFEDLGRYEEAMQNYDSANNFAYLEKFGTARFDPVKFASDFEHVGQTLETAFSQWREEDGSPSELPIFVIGMIRSGTTLVNQILSSHPEIGSVGEDGFWIDASRDLLPQGQERFDFAELRKAAGSYLVRLNDSCPHKKRVVNKQPANSTIVPLIYMGLPAARILHVVRGAMDTCLSIYTTVNGAKIEWAHNMANISFAFYEHARLMDRWRRLLPAGTMMEVAYEELVGDPERVSREMIAFSGLEWDPACLKPQDNPNPVMTPSMLQIRRPVYRTSVERWRKFEPWLEDFKASGTGR